MGNQNKSFHIRLDMPFQGQKIGFAAGVLLSCLVVGAVLVWIYLFSVDGGKNSRILWVELVVNGLMLVFNIYLICRVGYHDRYLQNLKVTYSISTVLSIIGLYVGRVGLLAKPQEGSPTAIYYFMEFIVYTLLSALMALVPAALICLVMWGIMKLFGR